MTRRVACSLGLFVCFHGIALSPHDVDLMPPQKIQHYKSLLPWVLDPRLNECLHSPETLWYDSQSIVPGYQDSMGSAPSFPEGFRPNTIAAGLIDGAVAGGWSALFAFSGRFQFPFGTGGADLSTNLHKINFWLPPKNGSKVWPVVYWKLDFSRWQWLFPIGTLLGEILIVKYTDGEERIFEIRIRERMADKWRNQIFRPFPTADSLAAAIQDKKPNWESIPVLRNLVSHLRNPATLSPRTLEGTHFRGSFARSDGALDMLPDFGDRELAQDLLSESPFHDVAGSSWKQNGSLKTYAASTKAQDSIVPLLYDGGMLEVTDVSCHRCHQDAGRQFGRQNFGDIYDRLILYGEIWGEDEIFSWHPFETKKFVDSEGDVVDFNGDNRAIRSDFIQAGLVKQGSASENPSVYRPLPRTWSYNPIDE